jgi:predicted nucleotidyltransferase
VIKDIGTSILGLFGYFVENNLTEDGDIDLLVTVSSDQNNVDNFMDLVFFLDEFLKRNVTPSTLESFEAKYGYKSSAC